MGETTISSVHTGESRSPPKGDGGLGSHERSRVRGFARPASPFQRHWRTGGSAGSYSPVTVGIPYFVSFDHRSEPPHFVADGAPLVERAGNLTL